MRFLDQVAKVSTPLHVRELLMRRHVMVRTTDLKAILLQAVQLLAPLLLRPPTKEAGRRQHSRSLPRWDLAQERLVALAS